MFIGLKSHIHGYNVGSNKQNKQFAIANTIPWSNKYQNTNITLSIYEELFNVQPLEINCKIV